MYKIGITGSIGTGKTTIANIFAIFNIPIFDADREIKKILGKKKIKQKLKNIWPLIIKKNHIDKLKLREIIFSNKIEKKKLEKLLYPYLEIEFKKFETTNFKKNIVVYDVPLIYETKTEKRYDKILLAHCNKETQRERVLTRDKISDTLFEKILTSQLSLDDKLKFKPKVINTNNKLFTLIKVCSILIKILIMIKLKNGKEKINT
jgi:dephospho-CoA kinase